MNEYKSKKDFIIIVALCVVIVIQFIAIIGLAKKQNAPVEEGTSQEEKLITYKTDGSLNSVSLECHSGDYAYYYYLYPSNGYDLYQDGVENLPDYGDYSFADDNTIILTSDNGLESKTLKYEDNTLSDGETTYFCENVNKESAG